MKSSPKILIPTYTCLYCLETCEDISEYHPTCSRKFFSTAIAPKIEFTLDEMDKLASKIIRSHGTIPGVQTKISLDFKKSKQADKTNRLTLVGLWGSFILKPPTQRFPHLPEMEDATMHLAALMGIRTVPHALIRLGSGELAYITRRIDRQKKTKLAMEDLCQVTGRLTEDKYKGSVEQAGKALLQYSSQPGLDAVDFFSLILFCYLTGNADMHLKNFSIWQKSPGIIEFTPAYDLLSTKLLLPKDKEESAPALNGKTGYDCE